MSDEHILPRRQELEGGDVFTQYDEDLPGVRVVREGVKGNLAKFQLNPTVSENMRTEECQSRAEGFVAGYAQAKRECISGEGCSEE